MGLEAMTNPTQHRYKAGRIRRDRARNHKDNPKRTARGLCRLCGEPKAKHPIKTKRDLIEHARAR